MRPRPFLLLFALFALAGRAAGDEPPAKAPSPPAARVVAALGAAAQENAKAPPSARAAGDALADLYARKAAVAAQGDARAFLVGLAYAVDPSGTLAKFPLTASAFLGIETPEAAEKRTAAWGKPSLRGREDWLQHFWTSAALVALASEPAARAAGVLKEMADLQGASGFSFADLLADEAGISFAKWLVAKDTAKRIEAAAASFSGPEQMPEPEGFPDCVPKAEFEKKYGSTTDRRFQKMQAAILAAVAKVEAKRLDPRTPKR